MPTPAYRSIEGTSQGYLTAGCFTEDSIANIDVEEHEDEMIVDIDAAMPHCQDPGQTRFTHLEEVSMTCRKITWEHRVAGTSGSDDWRSPIV
jgi:type VI protein secretion system component Hcp